MKSQNQTIIQESVNNAPMSGQSEKASQLQMVVNVVACCTDTDLEQMETTWLEVCSLLTEKPVNHGLLSMKEYQNASSETKKREKDHAAWIPASLKDQKGGRKQENIVGAA